MDRTQEVQNTSAKDIGGTKFPSSMRQFIEYHYVVLCKCCGSKVLDPDKKKNQTHLKGKCPSCGRDPAEEKRNKKKEKKGQAQRASRASKT